MQSAYAGTLEIMEALLEAGADVKARNRRGATALHWAISDPMKTKLLLLHGADVDARTVDGRTALHAATMQPSGARVVKLLLEVGADVDARTMTGNTPLFGAAAAGLDNTLLLLDHGADPNLPSQNGATPLMVARTADVVGCWSRKAPASTRDRSVARRRWPMRRTAATTSRSSSCFTKARMSTRPTIAATRR